MYSLQSYHQFSLYLNENENNHYNHHQAHSNDKHSCLTRTELDDDDYSDDSYSHLGTNCTDGNSEVNTLILGKFSKNEEP